MLPIRVDQPHRPEQPAGSATMLVTVSRRLPPETAAAAATVVRAALATTSVNTAGVQVRLRTTGSRRLRIAGACGNGALPSSRRWWRGLPLPPTFAPHGWQGRLLRRLGIGPTTRRLVLLWMPRDLGQLSYPHVVASSPDATPTVCLDAWPEELFLAAAHQARHLADEQAGTNRGSELAACWHAAIALERWRRSAHGQHPSKRVQPRRRDLGGRSRIGLFYRLADARQHQAHGRRGDQQDPGSSSEEDDMAEKLLWDGVGCCPVCYGTYYTRNGKIRRHSRTVRIVGEVGSVRRIKRPCPGSGKPSYGRPSPAAIRRMPRR